MTSALKEAKEEFKSSIKILSVMSSSYKYKNSDYLLFFSLGERDDSLIITITEGFSYLWAKEMDYNDFVKIRNEIGIHGAYSNFFQLFKEAILLTNGHFKLEIQPNNEMDLTVFYRITKTATLAGVINIGSPMQFEQDKAMFRHFIRRTLMDLQMSKKKEAADLERQIYELKEKIREAEERIEALSKSGPVPAMVLPKIRVEEEEPQKENKRRKVQGDLINPNLKKRKALGAKIGNDFL